MKVEIGFDLAVNGVGNWFTLDDTTKGKLDNTTYKLSGEVLVDVTSVTRDVSIRRGRSRTLERFTAGGASVTLDNRNRNFDPLYSASPYYGSITPRRMVRISVDGVNLFTGNVEDWRWDYDIGGDAVAIPQAVDGFAVLATGTVTPGTATSQLTGARIGTVLTQVGWPATDRVISTGAATLDADVVEPNTNALNYIQKIEVSEPGAAFIDVNGAFKFLSRTDIQNYSTSSVVFGPSGIPFVDYETASVTEDMKNQVAITWSAGTVTGGTATATDAASVSQYGPFSKDIDTLLSSSAQAQDMANRLVATYKTPTLRFNSVTGALHGMTSAQVAQVLALDLGSPVSVSWTPNNIGSAISQYVVIDQIEHTATPDSHFVKFTLSQSAAGFVLDSAQFGVLDTSRLGY